MELAEEAEEGAKVKVAVQQVALQQIAIVAMPVGRGASLCAWARLNFAPTLREMVPKCPRARGPGAVPRAASRAAPRRTRARRH